jgi:hypothetical protein
MNDLPEPAIARPNRPIPMPQAIDVGRFWPTARPVGPRSPIRDRGRLGVGIGEVAPMSRRANASTPMTKSTSATTATGTSVTQSNWPASGTWFDVQPNQERLASGASDGIAAW